MALLLSDKLLTTGGNGLIYQSFEIIEKSNYTMIRDLIQRQTESPNEMPSDSQELLGIKFQHITL